MIIDTIMALWNLIWFSRVKKVIVSCFLLGVGVVVILTLVGLPAFSHPSSGPQQTRTVPANQPLPVTDNSIVTQPHPGVFVTPITTKIASETPILPQPAPVPAHNPQIAPVNQPAPVAIEPALPFLPLIPAPAFPFYPAQIKQAPRHSSQPSQPATPTSTVHLHLFVPIGRTPTATAQPTTIPTTPTATTVPVPTPVPSALPSSSATPIPSMTGTIPVLPVPAPPNMIVPTAAPTSHIVLPVA